MKKIVFLTGTRADWGKIKSLVSEVKDSKSFEYKIFICGMHLLELYGSTYHEILKDGFNEVAFSKPYQNHDSMDLILSEAIENFSLFVKDYQPDLIVIHGDRLEALSGALVGAFNNILVAHIEGGEVSGTIDESIRHSISKFAHLHFVANNEAYIRLLQLGEKKEKIFTIGSPDIDLMLSKKLPTFEDVQKHYYQIKNFQKDYAIFIYHPVTTEIETLENDLIEITNALIESKINYIVIYPNNDNGSKIIIKHLTQLPETHFKIFTSIKFEFFLTLLKEAKFIIGNSSAGIREAPVYGTPCINIGTRQEGRYKKDNHILSINPKKEEILQAIQKIPSIQNLEVNLHFGTGNSAKKFIKILENPEIWKTKLQKKFIDL